MPRRARPKCPPLPAQAASPPPCVSAASVVAWARREGVALAVPAENAAAALQAVADSLHAARTAPRDPPPTRVLEWLDEGDRTARALVDLIGSPDDAARLVPDLAAEDLAAIARLRAALMDARWRHLARAVTATGGRPKTGAAAARAEIAKIGAECFAPPLRGRHAAAFGRWFFSLARTENGGRRAPGFAQPHRASLQA